MSLCHPYLWPLIKPFWKLDFLTRGVQETRVKLITKTPSCLQGDPGPFKTMPESPIHMADSGIDIQPLTNGQI